LQVARHGDVSPDGSIDLQFHRDEKKDTLRRGEEVEWPFGSLKSVRHPRKEKRGWYLGIEDRD
jgi:hypothetical protein